MHHARLVWADTLYLLRHSGAMYYYLWLSVATAAHHLVVTYWQAAVPSAADGGPLPPPPPAPGTPGTALRDATAAIALTAVPTPSADLGNATHDDCSTHPAGESLNGYTQAVASLLGGGVALLPMLGERCMGEAGSARVREALMVIGPLGLSAALYSMSVVAREELYLACYVIFHVGFELMRVLCEAEGARCVAATRCVGTPRFAAVSGLNTTLSLALQSALQFVFNTPQRLPLEEQFRLLAAMLLALFVAYACLACWSGPCGRGQAASVGRGEEEAQAAAAHEPRDDDYQQFVPPAPGLAGRGGNG